jgi:hypothetical protein
MGTAFFLEEAAHDERTPPSHYGLARRAFLWPPLDIERLSFPSIVLPPRGADPTPCLECAVLGSLKGQACYVAAWLLLRCSGRLEGSG